MSDEIVHTLGEDGAILGEITRAEAENKNHTTENVIVFVFNPEGKVWVQLRSLTKKHFPGLWDVSACGGVNSGESHQDAARRETKEETGLDVDMTYVTSFMNIFPGDNGEERRRLSHVCKGATDKIPTVNDEVDEFKLWDVSELRKDIVKNAQNYIPSFLVELDIALGEKL